MNCEPNVSFLICTRNRAETVRDCVMHLLNSGRSDIEIIIRDNFSTDNTLKLLRGIVDDRLKIHQAAENQGTRNFFEIAKLASGRIVTWLSDEDDFQFGYLDYIISQFESSTCEVMLGSITVGANHHVYFDDVTIENTVAAHLTTLLFSGCGGVFIRRSSIEKTQLFKVANDDDAYILWNYYPIGFFAGCCLKGSLQTTSKILVKQTRHAITNNNWSTVTDSRKRLPHYYPESIFDRLSSNITNVIYRNIPRNSKFCIIAQLIRGFYRQTKSYRDQNFISLLQENYDEATVRLYIEHINNSKLENLFFRAWYLLLQTARLPFSVIFRVWHWQKLKAF